MPRRAVVLASLAAAAEAFVASGPAVAALRPRVRLDGTGSRTGVLSLRAVGQRPSGVSAKLRTPARKENTQISHVHAHPFACLPPLIWRVRIPARLLRSGVLGVRVWC